MGWSWRGDIVFINSAVFAGAIDFIIIIIIIIIIRNAFHIRKVIIVIIRRITNITVVRGVRNIILLLCRLSLLLLSFSLL